MSAAAPGLARGDRRRHARAGRARRGARAARRARAPRASRAHAGRRGVRGAPVATGPRQRHRRVQAPVAVARRAAGGLRSGRDRARVRTRRRGRHLDPHRAGLLRRLARAPRGRAGGRHDPAAAQGLHRRRISIARSRAAGADADPADRRGPRRSPTSRACREPAAHAAWPRWSKCTMSTNAIARSPPARASSA